jgi:hypothetical protein
MRESTLQPKGYFQDTSIDTATALTVPAGATKALIKVEAQAARWRDDGVDPTAAIGMLIDVGDELWYTGQLRAIKFISATAGSSLSVSFYA